MTTTEQLPYEVTALSLHDHCLHCIVPLRCQNLLPENRLGCTVIRCPQDCEARFHSCKAEEHLILCPLVRVPCINRFYGCSRWMSRSETGPHLKHCPASVIYCSSEWNRKPLSQLAKSTMKKLARDFLNFDKTCAELENGKTGVEIAPDIAFALSDQRKIQRSYKLPRSIRNRTNNFFNRYHPQLPLIRRYSGSDFGSAQVNESTNDSLPRSTIDSSDEDEAQEKLKIRNSLSPVMRECVLCKYDPGSQHLHVLGTGKDFQASVAKLLDLSTILPEQSCVYPKIYAENGLFMKLSPDFLPRTVKKQRQVYTFVCSQPVRRDNFFWHYKNLHNDVINSIDGWAHFRCPYMLYGCDKLFTRLLPKDDNVQKIVRYNSFLDTFAVTVGLKNFSSPSPSTERKRLTELPHEILLNMTSYLDGASLQCLAATCSQLRDVCEGSLSQKGIVEQKWIRTEDSNGRVSWIQGPFVWSFSNCFTPVRNWTVTNNAEYLNHIANCPARNYKVYTEDRICVRYKDPILDAYADHSFKYFNNAA